MKLHKRILSLAAMLSVLLISGPVGVSPVQADTTYSGRAFAAYVNVPTLGAGPFYISDTEELPSGGGFRSASLLSANVVGVLNAGVLIASTSGASSSSKSSASLAELVVLPGHAAQLTASFVRAESEATCDGVHGDTEVVSLTFGGQTILVPPGGFPKNYTVEILGVAKLIINEQATTSTGAYREIRVNALHLTLVTGDEVILSSAKSDIDCVPPPPPVCHDFVTGGGWINVGSSRANFGFNAGFKQGSDTPDVHLNYIDHGAGMKVKATSIAVYRIGDTSVSRHFEGDCEINGVPGYTYSVDVADNAEPGRAADTFRITLSSNYSAGGTLAGGNIQLHRPCQ
jgi:hypothetical protein